MKKVEVLFNQDGKRIILMVDEKLYHFKQRLDKNGVKVLEPVGWFYGRPLKNGFIIDTVVSNGDNNISDKESLLFYALQRLGMKETPYIRTGHRTATFNHNIAFEILKNITSFSVMDKNKLLTN